MFTSSFWFMKKKRKKKKYFQVEKSFLVSFIQLRIVYLKCWWIHLHFHTRIYVRKSYESENCWKKNFTLKLLNVILYENSRLFLQSFILHPIQIMFNKIQNVKNKCLLNALHTTTMKLLKLNLTILIWFIIQD